MDISLHESVDREIFAGFVAHISSNPALTYRERLDWALSLHETHSQNDVLNKYWGLHAQTSTVASPQSALEWALIEFSVGNEVDLDLTEETHVADSPHECEVRIASILAKVAPVPGIGKSDTSLTFDPTTESAAFAMFLDECGAANTEQGLIRSAKAVHDLASRLIPEEPIVAPAVATNLNRRGRALLRLEYFLSAFECQSKAIQVLNTATNEGNPPPIDLLSEFLLDYAESAILVGEYSEGHEAIEMVEQVLPHFPNDLIAESLKARSLLHLATQQTKTGDVSKALDSVQSALKRFLGLPQRLQHSLMFHIVFAHRLLLTVLDLRGDWHEVTAAMIRFQERFANTSRLKRTDVELEYARLRSIFAIVNSRKGATVEPAAEFKEVLKILERHKYQQRPQLHREAAATLVNLASALSTKEPQQAIDVCLLAEQLLSPNRGKDPAILRLLGSLYGNWASALRASKKLVLTLDSVNKSLDAFSRLPGGSDADPNRSMVARVIGTRANIYFENGDFEEAKSDYTAAISVFEEEANLLLPELALDRLKICRAAARLLGRGFDSDWATVRSARMAIAFDDSDPDGFEVVSLAAQFEGFHCEWLKYCVAFDLDRVAMVLSSLQGRNHSRLATEEITTNELHGTRNKLKSNRRAFRDKADQARDEFRKELGASIGGSGDHRLPGQFGKSEALLKSALELHTEYRVNAAGFQSRRRELFVDGATSVDVFRSFSPITIETVRGRLRDGDVLVCCVDLFDASELEEHREIKGLWVLSCHTAAWVALDLNLERCTDLEGVLGDSSRANRNMRSAPDRMSSSSPHPSVSALKHELESSFWAPLHAAIPEQPQRIIFATYGRFHLFPFHLGNPFVCSMRYVPGLFSLSELPPSQFTIPEASMCCVVLNDTLDLPFANGEGRALLVEIWRGRAPVKLVHEFPHSDPPMQISKLHICGHGEIRRIENRRRAFLRFGPEKSISDGDLLQLGVRATNVWLSACVVGYAREDDEGDPMGFIVPFLMNGSRYVVACLTAVPDRWMPLLVGLTEWISTRHSLVLPEALALAKESLSNWVERQELQDFKEIYSSWLRSTWADIFRRAWQAFGFEDDRQDANAWVKFASVFSESVLPVDCSVAYQETTFVDHLVAISLIPPPDVRELLTYSVRAFGV